MPEITDEVLNDPAVQAAIRKTTRNRIFREASDAIGDGRKHGEVAYLRNAAANVDKALEVYDSMKEPPSLAYTLAAAFDEIVQRLSAIAVEIREQEAAQQQNRRGRRGRGSATQTPAE